MNRIFVFIGLFILIKITVYSQTLNKYSCFVDRVYVQHFESMKGKSFDKEGIMMQNNSYHPLTICQYGILCHNEFIETEDSLYFHKLCNQVKYFTDSSKINYLFDGKGIGLPYNFKFHDLKPPWYSGMTQGYAVSLLLRYYSLTKDEDIIPIIQKAAYLLTQHQAEGGVLSKSEDGYYWIEEYPKSKKAPQVLNGSINGIIGLKEYCDFFPNDSIAKELFDSIYIGLKAAIPTYDIPNWSTYDKSGKKLSTLYMHYEINEMEHLHQIFNDDFFYRQLMIWSTYVYKKPNKGKIYKRGTLNYSVPIEKTDTFFRSSIIKLDTLGAIDSSSMTILNFKKTSQVKNRYFKGKKIRNYKKPKTVLIDFDKELNLNFVKSPSNTNFSLYSYKNETIESIPYKRVSTLNGYTLIELGRLELNNLIFEFKNKDELFTSQISRNIVSCDFNEYPFYQPRLVG